MQRTLDQLVADGKLVEKSYGKQKVYVIDQVLNVLQYVHQASYDCTLICAPGLIRTCRRGFVESVLNRPGDIQCVDWYTHRVLYIFFTSSNTIYTYTRGCSQSHFPDVDESELKSLDREIAERQTQLQESQAKCQRLSSGPFTPPLPLLTSPTTSLPPPSTPHLSPLPPSPLPSVPNPPSFLLSEKCRSTLDWTLSQCSSGWAPLFSWEVYVFLSFQFCCVYTW